MKRLIILRHAKSDWGKEGLRDIDRHLNNRGYDDAYAQSVWLKSHQDSPLHILSSTATRALSTAMIFAKELKVEKPEFMLEPSIYEAGLPTLREIIAQQNTKINSLLFVGHNPGLTELCNALSQDLFFDNLPTCGLVAFESESKTWAGLTEGKWPVKFYKYPKE